MPGTITDNHRFHQAIERFDAFNRADPNREISGGKEYPKELLYAERMTRWLARLEPDAPETLRLAVRCQHIGRWMIPRADYPLDRPGYHRWRTALAELHARTARDLLQQAGYDEGVITRVEALVKKKNLKTDAEAQLLEDVACLVFLENYFSGFAKKHDEEKLVTIIQKTWKKMSPRAQQAALGLDLPPAARELIERALKPQSPS
ncbi:MAG: DUF4202 domain-containing protein [Gammaproteobacteria bacterium]|nr:MAG: DUF4202 domain-containing protein [Gammaproteobacteria bacterium]